MPYLSESVGSPQALHSVPPAMRGRWSNQKVGSSNIDQGWVGVNLDSIWNNVHPHPVLSGGEAVHCNLDCQGRFLKGENQFMEFVSLIVFRWQEFIIVSLFLVKKFWQWPPLAVLPGRLHVPAGYESPPEKMSREPAHFLLIAPFVFVALYLYI